MAKRGRKSKWETHVKPRLEEIKQWVRDGLYEEDIIKKLKISSSTFYEYKNKFPELSDIIVDFRKEAVEKLERSGLDIALGYEYEEEKMIIQLDDSGRAIKRTKEIYKKKQPPNATVYMFLLNNWSEGKYSKDPLANKFKEEELKLKQEASKYDEW